MAISTNPIEILRADRLQAQHFTQQVGLHRTLDVLRKAQRNLERRLKQANGLGGPGKESFTAAQLKATLAQIRAVTAEVKIGVSGVTMEQGKELAQKAAVSAVKYMNASEQKFTGSTNRLGLHTAMLIDRATAGTESSILHRLSTDPNHPGRKGILDRYGDLVVNHFEDELQQRLIARTPWAEVRDNITKKSAFLQGAPAHWAERIVRTEGMYAANRAGNEAIKEADDAFGDMVKIISSVFDDRTGADSFAVHGQIRRPTEAFDSWFGSYMHPPDRPNDRSVVVPHRIAWPIPGELKAKGSGEISARWHKEGRKGSPPAQPKISTIPLDQFGKAKAPPVDPSKYPAGNAPEPVRSQQPAAAVRSYPTPRKKSFVPEVIAPKKANLLSKKIAGATGSNPGGIYEGDDGVQRYVKFYKDPAQAVGEHLANSLYSDLGLGGVNSQTFDHNGSLAYASEIKHGVKTLGSDLTKPLAKKALDGFAADVLMANWDAAGLSLDNMLVDSKGSITRIDNGAAFLTRAQGARKPQHLLENPTEWESLLDPGKNPAYAKLAAKAGVTSHADMAASIKKGVKAIEELHAKSGGWAKYVSERAQGISTADQQQIVDMLDARMAYLKKKASELEVVKKPRKKKSDAVSPTSSTRPMKLTPITREEIAKTQQHFPEKNQTAGRYLGNQPELSELEYYTGSGYRPMNAALAGRSKGPESKEQLKLANKLQGMLLRAVDNGHAFEGIVYRGLKGLDEKTMNSFLTNEEFGFPAFTSTSVNEEISKSNFGGGYSDSSIMLRMRQYSGVPVDAVSQVQGEKEVLLHAGTRWKVVGRSQVDGKHWIDLEQM